MHKSNEEFKEKIINKYSKDINNIYNIRDYIILETIQECEKMISDTFQESNNTNKEIYKEKGVFSILVDKKYLLISKNDEFKNIFSIIYKYMLDLTKIISKNENFILNNIKEIISLINLILIFNDNITFYSLKKKILLLNYQKDIKNIDEIIINEYYFTCLKNKNGRKSLISWDYKYFLYKHFKNNLNRIKEENNKSYLILNLLNDQLNILGLKENIFSKSEFIINDLEIINEINIIQSRNYHLWTYLRKVYNDTDKEGKILILLFAFLLLRKCSFDYSAFSFIINSKQNMPFNNEQLRLLIEYIKKSSVIKYDEHKCYIDDIEKFILN